LEHNEQALYLGLIPPPPKFAEGDAGTDQFGKKSFFGKVNHASWILL